MEILVANVHGLHRRYECFQINAAENLPSISVLRVFNFELQLAGKQTKHKLPQDPCLKNVSYFLCHCSKVDS